MSTNREKFRAALARDEELLKSGQAPLGLSVCEDCGTVIQETVTGSRSYRDDLDPAKQKLVCGDCYFDAFDAVLSSHPIKSTPAIR